MIGDQGRVKVLDFGLAKLREESPNDGLTAAITTEPLTGEGRILGTVAYHFARAGARHHRRFALRRVFPGHPSIRDGHRREAVQGRHQRVDHVGHSQGHPHVSHRSSSGPATGFRSRPEAVPRKGSRRSVSNGQGRAERSPFRQRELDSGAPELVQTRSPITQDVRSSAPTARIRRPAVLLAAGAVALLAVAATWWYRGVPQRRWPRPLRRSSQCAA